MAPQCQLSPRHPRRAGPTECAEPNTKLELCKLPGSCQWRIGAKMSPPLSLKCAPRYRGFAHMLLPCVSGDSGFQPRLSFCSQLLAASLSCQSVNSVPAAWSKCIRACDSWVLNWMQLQSCGRGRQSLKSNVETYKQNEGGGNSSIGAEQIKRPAATRRGP
jgi:hypothetical protein